MWNQLAAPITQHTATLRELGSHLQIARDAALAAWCTAALLIKTRKDGNQVVGLAIRSSTFHVKILPLLWLWGQPDEVCATSLAAVLQQRQPGSK